MNFLSINDLSKEEAKTLIANVVSGMKVDMSSLPLLAENQKRMTKIIQGMTDSQLSKVVAHPYEHFSIKDVAEFYLNATISRTGVHSSVQGQRIFLNADALNEFFGVQLDSQDPESSNLIALDSVEVSTEGFVQTYCRPEAAGLDKLYMKKFQLKKDYEKLVTILHRCLWCKTASTDEMNTSNAKAIFAVHHGMNINWGEVTFGSITDFIKKKDSETGLFSTKMGHGLLISAILAAKGVQLRDPIPVDHTKTIFLTASPKFNIAISSELRREERLEKKREEQAAKARPAKKVTKTPKQPEQSQVVREVRQKKKSDNLSLPEKETAEKAAPEMPSPKATKKSAARKLKQKRRKKMVVLSGDSDNSSTKPRQKKRKTKVVSPANDSAIQGELAPESRTLPETHQDSAPELPNSALSPEREASPEIDQETDFNIILQKQFDRVLAWRRWRMGPLQQIIQFFDAYEEEEAAVLHWVSTDDVSKCFNLTFLISVLQKKKDRYQGKAPTSDLSPVRHVRALEEEEMETFDAWLMEKKRKESMIKFRHSALEEGEPSTANDIAITMEQLIKEWRESVYSEIVLEVIPTPPPSPPQSPITLPSPSKSPSKPSSPPHQKTPSPQQKTSPSTRTPSHQKPNSSSSSPKQKIASPCRAIVSFRNRSPSPPPSPPQQNAPLTHSPPQHQDPSPTSKSASPQRSSHHSAASTPKKKPIFRVPSSSSDNDGFLTSSIAADETSKRRRTPPRVPSPPPSNRAPPLPKGRGLETPDFTPEESKIPFTQFVKSAEAFGGILVQDLSKIIELNDKQHEELTHTNLQITIGFQHLSDKVAALTENLHNFMHSSTSRIDSVSRDVSGLNSVLHSHSQALLAQNQTINRISESVHNLQKSADSSSQKLNILHSLCKEHQEQGLALLKSDRERYQKMVLLEVSTRDLQSAVDKQQSLIEGLASVTQTLPETLDEIRDAQASEFSKIELLLGDLCDAKKGEDTREGEGTSTRALSIREPSSVDPTPYFDATRKKRLAATGTRPPPPPPRSSKKKPSSFSFTDWMKSGLSRPDRVQFEQMRKLMTPLQRENLFMDNDGLVQINHGGSIEEAEMWYGMKILNGKNSAEAVRNYLDCKLAPHWADYQNPRDLASIRAKVNAELERIDRAGPQVNTISKLEPRIMRHLDRTVACVLFQCHV
ncbi:unnamed protein product [Cuscuta europaea]|uniref:t-SNARE coiled-coil homology domain-containing protein n=1 Tax=Cuscuta europaea TaxID=41803 RepID=A0A9P0ZI93_CUSEU|nr:unnamed protein product [Cuscuta europaea]